MSTEICIPGKLSPSPFRVACLGKGETNGMRFSLAPFSLRFLFFVFQDGAVWVPYINNPFFEGSAFPLRSVSLPGFVIAFLPRF
jgi:hypothetical protein